MSGVQARGEEQNAPDNSRALQLNNSPESKPQPAAEPTRSDSQRGSLWQRLRQVFMFMRQTGSQSRQEGKVAPEVEFMRWQPSQHIAKLKPEQPSRALDLLDVSALLLAICCDSAAADVVL